MCEGVLDHAHDDEARGEEIREGNPHHLAAAASQRHGENDQKQQGRDRRRPDSLKLDIEETPYLLQIERLEANQIDAPDNGDARGGPDNDRKSTRLNTIT